MIIILTVILTIREKYGTVLCKRLEFESHIPKGVYTKAKFTNQQIVTNIISLGDTLISPLKMFSISTLYYAMNARIDLMKLQFCTEIKMEYFYLAQI